MKIGNVILNGQVILAPMAGVCNSAYRKICKEMGAALVCAEMVSDKGMIYNSKKTKDMLYFEESERPISQQIFGSDKETFVKAAKMVYEIMKPEDFNKDHNIRKREFKWQIHWDCQQAQFDRCDRETPGLIAERKSGLRAGRQIPQQRL